MCFQTCLVICLSFEVLVEKRVFKCVLQLIGRYLCKEVEISLYFNNNFNQHYQQIKSFEYITQVSMCLIPTNIFKLRAENTFLRALYILIKSRPNFLRAGHIRSFCHGLNFFCQAIWYFLFTRKCVTIFIILAETNKKFAATGQHLFCRRQN